MMKKAKRKPMPKKNAAARKMSSNELCRDLAVIGGLVESEDTAAKIYEAVRRLQLLEKAAVEAGLLPS